MRKTKLTIILMVAVLMLAIMPTSVFALSGSGTEADPYIVSSEEDLALVKNDLSAYYTLGGNIALTSAWSPAGSITEPFTGVFFGDGYTISGLNITVNASDAVAGLFASNKGTIDSLNVVMGTGVNVTASESAYVGGITGYNMGGTISNCHVEGSITIAATSSLNTSNVYVGLIAGKSTGAVSYTNANGSVTATVAATEGNRTSANPAKIYAGGLIGLSTATQEHNFAVVDVDVEATSPTAFVTPEVYAGGISGENSGKIIETYAAGNVTATATGTLLESAAYAGGLIGKNSGGITYTNASGNVTAETYATSAKTYAGGLIGYSTGNITESFATGMVNADSTSARDTVYAGGLVALSGGLITRSYAVGEATATAKGTNAIQGGLVGYTVVAAADSYYEKSDAYTELTGCGIAKTEEEMKSAATFSGWDFNETWKISENQNSGYPYLVNLSGVEVVFTDAEYVYDGTEKTITAESVGDGVTIEYRNNKATDAGVYNAVAIVKQAGHATTVVTAKLTIYQKQLTVAGIKANDKEFDNTTAATLDVSAAVLEGVIEGDDVSIDVHNTVANFANKNVGEQIDVYVSGLKFTGSDAGNYYVEPLVLSANIFEGSFSNVVFEGSGTTDDPYLIRDEDELSAIRGNLEAHFKLANNIELTGDDWIPIGRLGREFEGSFDGSGYTISGITINPEINYTYSGLFGYSTGVISNLNVIVANNIYTTADKAYIGAIAGHSSGTITNCNASGNIATNPASTFVYVGGIVGMNAGKVAYSESDVIISAKGTTVYAGGVVGENAYIIETSGATGEVNVTDALFGYAGGFAGNNVGSIKNCYARGNVSVVVTDTGFMANAAGFAGRNEGGNISYAYSAGTPTVLVGSGAYLLTEAKGGFTAYDAGTITNCYYDSDASNMADVDKGTPKTTAELKTETTYSGWDFETWRITASKNDGYPYIKTLYTMSENALIRYDKDTGTITVNAYADIEGAYLVAASYNAGALVDIDIIENVNILEGETYIDAVKDEFVIKEGGSVKIMLWENMNTIRPLCSFVSVAIR